MPITESPADTIDETDVVDAASLGLSDEELEELEELAGGAGFHGGYTITKIRLKDGRIIEQIETRGEGAQLLGRK